MPTPLYYTVYIIIGRYPNASATEVMGTYRSKEAYAKARELEAQGHTVSVNYI
jgi:hypothetical protein